MDPTDLGARAGAVRSSLAAIMPGLSAGKVVRSSTQELQALILTTGMLS